MNVTAFKNGSFIIDFSTVCLSNPNLLFDAVKLAGEIIGIIVGFFEIKKFLKGNKPKEVEKININEIRVQNEYGQSIIVKEASGAVITNQKIDNLTVNVTNNIYSHNPLGGFLIRTEENEFKYSADDIKSMFLPLPNITETTCKVLTEDAMLIIKKADLIGYSTWDFKYRDHQISAKIEDEEWIEKVHAGNVGLRAGDYIKATIEGRVDLDSDQNPIPNTEKYRIIKVHGDVMHNYAEQTKLFREEN